MFLAVFCERLVYALPLLQAHPNDQEKQSHTYGRTACIGAPSSTARVPHLGFLDERLFMTLGAGLKRIGE
jgi:hypothetical protein